MMTSVVLLGFSVGFIGFYLIRAVWPQKRDSYSEHIRAIDPNAPRQRVHMWGL